MNEKLKFVFELFNSVQRDNINYIYRGHFDNYITENILSLAESNLVDSTEKSVVKKKVYHIMVECLQNITKHQATVEQIQKDESGVFFIQNQMGKYFLTTGNIIHLDSIDSLKKKIQKVNSLDKDELKKYYKQMLVNGELSDKGGAGLGLIDMARKSGNKLLSDFRKLNDEYSFFYLHTQIPSGKNMDTETEVYTPDSLIHITDLHKLINSNDIDIVFNHSFNQDSLMNLLSIVEGKLATDSLALRKRIFNIMVEMFQNIVHHGAKTSSDQSGIPGMFFISENEDEFLLNSVNYFYTDTASSLENKLDKLNSLSFDELNTLYNKTLLDFNDDEPESGPEEEEDSQNDSKSGAGLGFLDILLKSDNKLNFYILRTETKFSIFALQVIIQKKA